MVKVDFVFVFIVAVAVYFLLVGYSVFFEMDGYDGEQIREVAVQACKDEGYIFAENSIRYRERVFECYQTGRSYDTVRLRFREHEIENARIKKGKW